MSHVTLSLPATAVKLNKLPRARPRYDMQADGPVMSDTSPSQPLPAPKTKRGERTRQKILDAAEREIGRKGFAEASISTITAEAAVGQGTFYLYFRSKEDVLRELVLRMGRRLRRHLTLAIADAPTRLEAERRGLRAFLEFVRANPDLYRVVAEFAVRRPGDLPPLLRGVRGELPHGPAGGRGQGRDPPGRRRGARLGADGHLRHGGPPLCAVGRQGAAEARGGGGLRAGCGRARSRRGPLTQPSPGGSRHAHRVRFRGQACRAVARGDRLRGSGHRPPPDLRRLQRPRRALRRPRWSGWASPPASASPSYVTTARPSSRCCSPAARRAPSWCRSTGARRPRSWRPSSPTAARGCSCTMPPPPSLPARSPSAGDVRRIDFGAYETSDRGVRSRISRRRPLPRAGRG